MVSSWAAAKRLLRTRTTCRSFLTKGVALDFFDRIARCDTTPVIKAGEEEVLAAAGVQFKDPYDPRNVGKEALSQFLQPPNTAPRLELLAACIGAETCTPPGLVRTNSDVVLRAYREAFPSEWANQDLIQRLATAAARGVRITQIV